MHTTKPRMGFNMNSTGCQPGVRAPQPANPEGVEYDAMPHCRVTIVRKTGAQKFYMCMRTKILSSSRRYEKKSDAVARTYSPLTTHHSLALL